MSKSILLLILLVLAAAAPTIAGTDDPQLADLIAAVREAGEPMARTQAFRALSAAVQRGPDVLDESTAEDLALLLVDLLFEAGIDFERFSAQRMAQQHAHPALADPLLRYLARHPDDPLRLGETTRIVLARLGDPRILDLLVADLHGDRITGVVQAIEQLAELGDARAIPHLEALRADPCLAERMSEALVARRHNFGNDTSPEQVRRSGRRDEAEIDQAVDLALRKLRFAAEHGIVCGFDLDDSALAVLARQGFVIPAHPRNELFEWYSKEYPFVTTDFAYHTWMILVRAAFDDLERMWLRDAVGRLAAGLVRGTTGRSAAFCAVPAVLCGSLALADLDLDETARQDLLRELSLIAAADTRAVSPLLDVKEDYTAYRPRGRFTDDGSGYFQAVTWLGRGTFRANDPGATRRALEITGALHGDPDLAALWTDLDRVLTLLAGRHDDATPADYLLLAEEASGLQGPPAVDAVLVGDDFLAAFLRQTAALSPPRIHTGLDADRIGARGLRLLGQRYSRDAHLFQHLMENGVWPPSGLHVLAGLLGSERAARHLGGPVALPPDMPAAGGPSLMEGFLACHGPLFDHGGDLPAPFDGDAWRDKELNAALGAWAETRHALAPYLKAAHQYMGMSAMTDRLHGFVEPYPEFFTRLATRVRALHELLAELDFYDAVARRQDELNRQLDARYGKPNKYGVRKPAPGDDWEERYRLELAGHRLDRERLPAFAEILDRLAPLAVKGRDGAPQDAADGMFLKGLAERMRRISFHQSNLPVAEQPMSRVVDVANEYLSGECLEAGVGRALPIYVAVSDGERRIVCRGGVYSYYEFTVPLAERLDDRVWACLAARLGGPGRGPWLEEVGLLHRPVLGRAALLSLGEMTEGQGYSFLGRPPWTLRVDDHYPTGFWVGARTDAANVDILLDLVQRDDLLEGVQLFLTSELARHGTDPAARAWFAATADRLLVPTGRRPSIPGQLGMMQLHFVIEVLAASKIPEDRERRERLAEMIEAWPMGKHERWDEIVSCYRVQVRRATATRTGTPAR